MLLGQDRGTEAEPLVLESVRMYREHPDWDPEEFRHALFVLATTRAKGGRYYTCDGPEHHVIRAEADLAWQNDLGSQMRDDGLEQPTVDQVLKNFPGLIARPELDSEVPF